MCLANAYLKKGDKNELFMANVAFIEIGDERMALNTIFGETKEVGADIKKIDFANSSIYLEMALEA